MKARNIIAVEPRSEIAFAAETYWMQMQLHESAGAVNAAWKGRGASGTAVSGQLAISGTTASIFNAFGEFTSAGDNGTVADASMLALLGDIARTDIEGTTFIFFRASLPAVTSDGYFFSMNNSLSGAPNIGFAVRYLSASAKVQLAYNNFTPALLSATSLGTSNTPATVGCALQSDGNLVSMEFGVNGVSEDTDTSNVVIPPLARASFFSILNNYGLVNTHLNAGVTMSDFLMFRKPDLSLSRFSEFFSAYDASPRELPWKMDGE